MRVNEVSEHDSATKEIKFKNEFRILTFFRNFENFNIWPYRTWPGYASRRKGSDSPTSQLSLALTQGP